MGQLYFFSPFHLTLFPKCLAPKLALKSAQKLKTTKEWHYERLSICLRSILHNFQGNLPTVHSGKKSTDIFYFLIPMKILIILWTTLIVICTFRLMPQRFHDRLANCFGAAKRTCSDLLLKYFKTFFCNALSPQEILCKK